MLNVCWFWGGPKGGPQRAQCLDTGPMDPKTLNPITYSLSDCVALSCYDRNASKSNLCQCSKLKFTVCYCKLYRPHCYQCTQKMLFTPECAILHYPPVFQSFLSCLLHARPVPCLARNTEVPGSKVTWTIQSRPINHKGKLSHFVYACVALKD